MSDDVMARSKNFAARMKEVVLADGGRWYPPNISVDDTVKLPHAPVLVTLEWWKGKKYLCLDTEGDGVYEFSRYQEWTAAPTRTVVEIKDDAEMLAAWRWLHEP